MAQRIKRRLPNPKVFLWWWFESDSGDDLIGRKMIDNMMIQVSKLSQKSENKSQKLRIEKSRKKDRK